MTGADSVSPPRGHFVVATFGTLGNFLPAFGIARELAAAGHRVDMVAPRYFAPHAHAPGVRFVGHGDPQAYARDLADPPRHQSRAGLGGRVLQRGIPDASHPGRGGRRRGERTGRPCRSSPRCTPSAPCSPPSAMA